MACVFIFGKERVLLAWLPKNFLFFLTLSKGDNDLEAKLSLACSVDLLKIESFAISWTI
jgi:hypothetical protein